MGKMLRASPLLADFDAKAWADLRGQAVPFALAAGQTLFRQGDPPDALYLVESGLLEIATRIPGDEAALIAAIRPGEIVGEFALLDEGPRSAHVAAAQDTTGLVISRRRFHAMLADGSPWTLRLGTALRRLVAQRTRATLARIEAEARYDLSTLRSAGGGGGPSAVPGDGGALMAGLSRLAGLGKAGLDALGALGRLEAIGRGGGLARPGAASGGLTVVLRGAVRASIPREGGLEQVFVFGPGAFVGLTGYSDGGGQPLHVTAAEDCLLLTLGAGALAALDQEPPPWFPALVAAMGRQLVHDQRKANRHLGRALALQRFNLARESA